MKARGPDIYKQLQWALLFSWLVHGLGLLTMAVMLQPGLADFVPLKARAEYIQNYPLIWTLGWLPWNLAALANLCISIQLIRWVRSREGAVGLGAAVLSLVFTVLAVIPDQGGEFLMVTRHVQWAKAATHSGSELALTGFRQSERQLLGYLGLWANNAYVLMGLFWTLAVVAVSSWERAKTLLWLTGASTLFFILMSVLTYVRSYGDDQSWLARFEIMVLVNAFAFPLLQLQFLAFADTIGDVQSQDYPATDAAAHRFVWPYESPYPKLTGLLETVLNSKGLRDFMRPLAQLSSPVLKSNIENVVYLNWLVPTERVKHLLPEPLAFDEFQSQTVVSLLTYRHGHFGPAIFGPLRWLLPSPTQSNWRFYVLPENKQAARDGIYFFKTMLSQPLYTFGSRLLSDGLPSHWAPTLIHECVRRPGHDMLWTVIEAGRSNAPDLRAELRTVEARVLPESWSRAFESWEQAVQYLIEQNRGLNVHPHIGQVIESRISIPITLADIKAAECSSAVESEWLKDVIMACDCFAFVVPSLTFRALGESATYVEQFES